MLLINLFVFCVVANTVVLNSKDPHLDQGAITQMIEEASLQSETSGAAAIEFNGKIVIIAVGEGLPANYAKEKDLATKKRVAQYAAYSVAKGEIVKFLEGMDIKSKTEYIKKIVVRDSDNYSEVEIEEKTTELYSAFCESTLRGIRTLSSNYDEDESVARVVVLSIPEDAISFNLYGPNVIVAESKDIAFDEITADAVNGTIPPCGAKILVIPKNDTEEIWLVGWGSDTNKNMRMAGIKSKLRAGKALVAFANNETVSVEDNFSSEFSKITKTYEDLIGNSFNTDTSLKEQTQTSAIVKSRARGHVLILKPSHKVKDSEWTMTIVGFKYVLSSANKFPPAPFGGLHGSLEAAFEAAKKWASAMDDISAVGKAKAFGTRQEPSWGVGVAIAKVTENTIQKEQLPDSLTLLARAAALRGLAIAVGKENRETVEAQLKGGIQNVKIYTENGSMRVFVLISKDEIQDIRTTGSIVPANQ